jgi:hypothetical protein
MRLDNIERGYFIEFQTDGAIFRMHVLQQNNVIKVVLMSYGNNFFNITAGTLERSIQ